MASRGVHAAGTRSRRRPRRAPPRAGQDGLAPADRGQHGLGQGPRLADIQRAGVAHDLPDPFVAMPAMDEEVLAPGRRHPDAEAFELPVSDIVGGLARRERRDSRVGEDGPGQFRSPGCGCSVRREYPRSEQDDLDGASHALERRQVGIRRPLSILTRSAPIRRRDTSRQSFASASALPRSMTAAKASVPVMAGPPSSPKPARTARTCARRRARVR